MSRILPTLLFGLALCFGLSSCASSIQLTGHWRAPNHQPGFKKVLVVGMAERTLTRRLFEDEFAKRLQARGLEAVQSYTLVPGDEDLNREELEAAMEGKGFDGALVTHVVDIARRREHHEGPSGAKLQVLGMGYGHYGHSYYHPSYYGSSFGSYYSVAYQYTHMDGYYTESKSYNLETAFYSVSDGALAWAVMSAVVDPDSAAEAIQGLADQVFAHVDDKKLL